MSGVSSTMLSPLVSWILSSSSSSSSSTSSDEEERVGINTDDGYYENNDNVDDHDENDHFLSSSDGEGGGGGTIPVALAVPDASPAVTVAFPGANDTCIPNINAMATTIVTRPKRQRTNYTCTGRQYQRLWTKEDEIELLKGYMDYIKQHCWATTSLQNDVALLYDHVRPKLNVGFNRNQLVEKLRRLKRKHKKALDKINSGSGSGKKEVSFKNPQEQAIFEISHKIWGNDRDQDALDDDELSPIPESHDLGNFKVLKTEEVDNGDEIENGVLRSQKRSRLITFTDDVNRTNDHDNGDNTTSIQGLIEETMRSCFSPLLKELFDNAQEGPLGGLAPNPIPLRSGEQSSMNSESGEVGDEQWRKRRILELEVYLNRLGLLQDQIKARLEELRSSSE